MPRPCRRVPVLVVLSESQGAASRFRCAHLHAQSKPMAKQRRVRQRNAPTVCRGGRQGCILRRSRRYRQLFGCIKHSTGNRCVNSLIFHEFPPPLIRPGHRSVRCAAEWRVIHDEVFPSCSMAGNHTPACLPMARATITSLRFEFQGCALTKRVLEDLTD